MKIWLMKLLLTLALEEAPAMLPCEGLQQCWAGLLNLIGQVMVTIIRPFGWRGALAGLLVVAAIVWTAAAMLYVTTNLVFNTIRVGLEAARDLVKGFKLAARILRCVVWSLAAASSVLARSILWIGARLTHFIGTVSRRVLKLAKTKLWPCVSRDWELKLATLFVIVLIVVVDMILHPMDKPKMDRLLGNGGREGAPSLPPLPNSRSIFGLSWQHVLPGSPGQQLLSCFLLLQSCKCVGQLPGCAWTICVNCLFGFV